MLPLHAQRFSATSSEVRSKAEHERRLRTERTATIRTGWTPRSAC